MWSSPISVTPPAAEPVTLAEAKTFLRVDGNALDSQIGAFIAVAREQIERITGTRMIDQVVTATADGFADLERLPTGPVSAVIEVKYLDQAGVEQTLDPLLYETFGADLEMGIRPTIGNVWPQVRPAAGAIAVTLQVGHADAAAVPGPLWLAIMKHVRATLDDEAADIDELLVNFRLWL